MCMAGNTTNTMPSPHSANSQAPGVELLDPSCEYHLVWRASVEKVSPWCELCMPKNGGMAFIYSLFPDTSNKEV